MRQLDAFASFLATHPQMIAVKVEQAEGSTPREQGAMMLVSTDAIVGTIGGGQLEFMAIEHARQMLAGQMEDDRLDIPLGPDIGQCCGGRVALSLRLVTYAIAQDVIRTARAADAARPQVFVFGAGHVGQALYAQLQPLPVAAMLIDARADALAHHAGDANVRQLAVPEGIVADAKTGSAFVVLTHDHAQDFLIASAAIDRGDAAYVGMIGSKTKRAVFARQYREQGGPEERLAALVCPIGGVDVPDKRPEIIAALTVAEILRAVLPSAKDSGN